MLSRMIPLLAALALAACPPAPTPPPPDGGDSGPPSIDAAPPPPAPVPDAAPPPPLDQYARACQAMAAIGCAEGNVATCADALRKAAQQRVARVDVAACAAATSKAQARSACAARCP